MAKKTYFDLGAGSYSSFTLVSKSPLTPVDADPDFVVQVMRFQRRMDLVIQRMLWGGFSLGPLPPLPREEDQPMPRFARTPPPPTRRLDEGDDPAVPPGKVLFTRGAATYNARLRLRVLGGRWDANLLGGCWVLPEENADAAEANVRLAERAGVELPLDEDPPGMAVEKITCYACGTRYAPWEFSKLQGAVLSDWYCGCEARKQGATPRTATTRRGSTRDPR